MKESTTIGLFGNPNSGKSSLFNLLTGLNQRTGNFPGVTVDKKKGKFLTPEKRSIELIDFPGTYSLFPNSSDERLVIDILTQPSLKDYPEGIIYVADASQLERHLLLATQIMDLKIPMIFCLNMSDLVANVGQLEKKVASLLSIPAISISSRKNENIDKLKVHLDGLLNQPEKYTRSASFYPISDSDLSVIRPEENESPYLKKLILHHSEWLSHISENDKRKFNQQAAGWNNIASQIDETLNRCLTIESHLGLNPDQASSNSPITEKIDRVITHRFWGPLIFFVLMAFVFQSIYAWSEAPMGWIESGFSWLGEMVAMITPDNWFRSLLVDGVIAGLGGVLVFIPQITILFLIITILEEIGYMSRAVFMFDGIMRKFGLNGRSIVSLVSSGACAIPAIMAARTITNQKERLITIMVSPLISCSARIPVYTVLVGFVVAPVKVWGIFNSQGLAFMGLYLLGIVGSLISALVFKKVLKSSGRSHLMMELPIYRPPLWKNVVFQIKEKVGTFIIEAGKVIVVISIILWFLASYGPEKKMDAALESAKTEAAALNLEEQEYEDLLAGKKLEASYAGHIGKIMEPAIRPLGYDWKIGIALLTSFAAREVFVGTMATIYSVGSSDDETTLREKLALEKNPETLKPRYDIATSLSLLIFYVFAMQCMSTLAVTKRETKSWKWPIIQFLYMGVLAYVGAFIAYQVLS